MMVIFFDPGLMAARLSLEAALPLAEGPDDGQGDVPGDGQGGAQPVWQEIGALWARIEPVSHVIDEMAGGETGTVSHRIWIHHRTGVMAGQRLRRNDRIFAIKLVRDPDETRRYLICHCEEKGR